MFCHVWWCSKKCVFIYLLNFLELRRDHWNTTKTNFTPTSRKSRCFEILFRHCQVIIVQFVFQVFSKNLVLFTQRSFSKRDRTKRKSNNDDKYGHGQEKRRPSTLCWGSMRKNIKEWPSMVYKCRRIKLSTPTWFDNEDIYISNNLWKRLRKSSLTQPPRTWLLGRTLRETTFFKCFIKFPTTV